MSLLIATTTIDIYSQQQEGSGPDLPYATDTTVFSKQLKDSGVRAVIDVTTGSETVAAGAQQAAAQFTFNCDPCDISHTDIVVDNSTGTQFEVIWVVPISGFGFNYMRGMLLLHTGTEYESI